MTLEEIKQKLKVFDKYTFEEDTHTYYCNGVKVGIGVTSLIGLYANKFDEQNVAEMVAQKQNKEVTQIIEEWHYKRDFSCVKGTTIHEYTQSLFSGNEWHLRPFDNSKEYLEVVDKLKHHSNNYYNDYKDRYIHIKDELLIGVEWADVSSAIDHLFYDKIDKGVVIIDYKTNSYMDGYYDNPDKKVYKKYMMIPFQDTLDNSYEHYKIQLSIYKYILQELLGIPVLRTEIVYLTENKDNYEVIQIPYEKEKAELMLELRRIKDMKSIPVLIMGASGTGKSFSFRNLPPEETAIISVAKSELPFRNKTGLKFVECDDYTKIASAIQGTKKRIICLDDTGYLMQFENFDKAMIKGYDKHTEMAKHYADLLKTIRKLDGEKIVYMTIHEDIIDGISKPKTTGKMINDNLCIEGLLNIVFRSVIKEGEHVFQTRSAGDSVAKTPYEMYEEEFIPNDLAEIDKTIREYYNYKPITEKIEEGGNK